MPLNLQDYLARTAAMASDRGFRKELIGPEIPAFSREGEGPVVLLSSGIHGDEPAGPLASLAFLESGPSTDFHWLLTPCLNPSGLTLGTREDASGRDLNRDYQLFASPETAAHRAWLDDQPVPDLFISLHEDYDATGFYFYEIQLAGHPSVRDAIFEKVRPHLSIEPGPIIDGRESSGDGWFFRENLPDLTEFSELEGGFPEALYLSQKGCPLSLTFETPTNAEPLEARVAGHLAAIEATLAEFRQF
ncbi:M14 family metallopeptidase [Roseibacillus persicicus]|uniref:M14 family metallopeptidase n=1 Tax=Roseibacillus persicicus TaxID=454148 RepID=UPI00280DD58F|nr:M14 family metallocarboxypeptidase [Roseibacillus persicicus]MDQ8189748.1 M14 family metallocarboxypeptidase [Roseibacillus persicicus]